MLRSPRYLTTTYNSSISYSLKVFINKLSLFTDGIDERNLMGYAFKNIKLLYDVLPFLRNEENSRFVRKTKYFN